MFSYCVHPSLTCANILCTFNTDHCFIVGISKISGGRMNFLTCPNECVEILENSAGHDVVMEKFWEAYREYHLYLASSRRPYEVEIDDGIREFFKQHCLGCESCFR